MYKQDLALNNSQRFIYHETLMKPNRGYRVWSALLFTYVFLKSLTQVQILDGAVSISHCAKTFLKSLNPTIIPQLLVNRTGWAN